jgi:hypothetical protein
VPPGGPVGGAVGALSALATVNRVDSDLFVACAARPALFLAAITRDSRHKRRHTGGRRAIHKKKRKFETGRPASMTKLSADKTVHIVRSRGGSPKFRALRLADGNFSWGSEGES